MNEKKAIEVLKEYLKAWKNRDYELMFRKSQKTYRAVHRDRKEADIEAFIGSKELTSYKLGDPLELGEAMVEIPVEIYYQQQKEKYHKMIKVRVIKEIEAYKPSVNGTWGVNPISAFREEEPKKVKEKKDES
jgi:uncharacterized protein with HEPN domain